jgi:multiple sugar transport system substrate-binding protein
MTRSRGIIALAALMMVIMTASIAQAKTEVRFALWAGTAEIETYTRIVRAFEKDNPDISVKIEYTDWGTYWQKLQTQFAAGNAPDVMRMSGAYLGKFVSDGLMENLQPYIDRDLPNLETDYFSTANIFKFDDQYYGLPEGGGVTSLYYNEDLFDEAGVAYPDKTWTWDTLRNAAMKLTKRTGQRTTSWGVTFDMGDGSNGEASWYNFLVQNGVQYLTPDKTKSAFGSKEAIEAIQFMVDLIQKDKVAPSPAQSSTLGDQFMTGRVAITYSLLPVQIPYRKDARFDWNVAPMPVGKQRASGTNYVGFSIYSKSKQRDAAWRLTRFISSEKGQRILAETRQMLPPLKSVAYSAEFSDPGKLPSRLREVMELTTQNVYDLQFTPTWAEWVTAAGKEINMAALGLKSVEDAMKAADEKVNAILATE